MRFPLMLALLFASIAEGHNDLADVLFLVACLVFVFVAVLHVMGTTAHELALIAVGLASMALAFLVL